MNRALRECKDLGDLKDCEASKVNRVKSVKVAQKEQLASKEIKEDVVIMADLAPMVERVRKAQQVLLENRVNQDLKEGKVYRAQADQLALRAWLVLLEPRVRQVRAASREKMDRKVNEDLLDLLG